MSAFVPWEVIPSPTDAEMSAVQGAYLVADKLPIEDAQLIAASRKMFDELAEARTTLSILRTQIMVEVRRGADRWEGVPEKLKERLDAIDAVRARATGVDA